jgi:aldehyde dehydrogenase (NAD+)
LGLGAASAAAQYVVTHPQSSLNPINLDFLLDPLSKSEFLSLHDNNHKHKHLTFEFIKTMQQNYISGEWVSGANAIDNINPSDLSDTIGQYAQADREQAEQALITANKAQPLWAAQGLEQRHQALMNIGSELIARAEELGTLLSREEGKPLKEGIGEIYRSGQFFQYYAAEVHRQIGDTADSVRPGIEIDVRREPVGVVVVISPWNFPTATAAWKIAPALAFGNAVVWKPANVVPASAHALTEIISRQDMPPGTFNLVMGSGGKVGDALINSSLADAITFTGSLGVGRTIAQASATNLTKFQLEMGSKNALVVMDDADLETAVNCAMNGAFSGSGQKCTASSRLIVHRDIHDAFVEGLIACMQVLKVGHALEPDTEMGPIVEERQLKENQQYIKLGQEEGAELAWGGDLLEQPTEGYYMAPGLFTGSDNAMRINREELFAPIACVIKVDDYEQALTTANDTEFGLTGGIVTQSLARATHFRRNLKTGCVMVNLPTAGTDYHVPFGGRGNSSFGSREQGQYAVEFYTQVKTAYIHSGAL